MGDIMINKMGTIIKNIRIKKGLTARQLANQSNYSNSYICDIEKNRKKGTDDTYTVLFEALGYDYEIFIKENEIIRDYINQIINNLLFLKLTNIEIFIREIERIQFYYNYTIYDDEICLIKVIFKRFQHMNVSKDEIKNGLGRLERIENNELVVLFKIYYLDFVVNYELIENVENYLRLILSCTSNFSIQGMVYYKIAEIQEKNKNFSEALESCNYAKKMFLNDMNMNRLYVVQLHVGNINVRMGDMNQALKIFNNLILDKKVQNIKEIYSITLNNLIWTSFICENYENTINLINKYYYAHRDEKIYFMLIWCYLHIDNFEKSMQLVQEVSKNKSQVISERLDLLIQIITGANEDVIEDKIKRCVKKIGEYRDMHSKLVLLRLLVYYYEKTHKYKYALKYSKLINDL